MPETIQQTLQRLAPGVVPVKGEPGVFEVQSKTRSGWNYRVDRLEFVPNGSCTCPRFLSFGCHSKLKRGTQCGPATRCEHLRRVDTYLSLLNAWNWAALMERGERHVVELLQQPMPRKKREVVKPIF